MENSKYRGYTIRTFYEESIDLYKNSRLVTYDLINRVGHFIYYYITSYYFNNLIEAKDLLLSEDEESQTLGFQLCCSQVLSDINVILESGDQRIIKNTIRRLQGFLEIII